MDQTTARRWEYGTLRPSRGETKTEAEDPVDELNALGADGWELVESVDYTGGGTTFLVTKRPAGDAPDGGAGEGA